METSRGISMSHRESVKYQVITKFLNGKLSRKETSRLLGVSERQVTRVASRVRSEGLKGVKHGNYGFNSEKKLPSELKSKVQELVKREYFDLNLVHLQEILRARHGIVVSYSTLRRWCWEKRLVKHPHKSRRIKRKVRSRMPQPGLLLQMDGSHHRFNGKDEWCLIAAIDDATSEIPYAEFFEGETTVNCMKVLKKIIELKGLPTAIYTDRAGWTGGNNKRDNFAQFARACEDLGIQLIFANSPEAKGRIERAFRTIQDRLIPELRMNGIEDITGANTYLRSQFLTNYWNKQNTVKPISEESAYRPVPEDMDITQALCIENLRKINKDQTISWKGKRYVIETPHSVKLQGYTAVVRTYLDGSLKAFVMGREVKLKRVTDYVVQDPAVKPRKATFDQKLYFEFYKEIHWLFNHLHEHRVTGKPLKLHKKKREA